MDGLSKSEVNDGLRKLIAEGNKRLSHKPLHKLFIAVDRYRKEAVVADSAGEAQSFFVQRYLKPASSISMLCPEIRTDVMGLVGFAPMEALHTEGPLGRISGYLPNWAAGLFFGVGLTVFPLEE